MSHNEESPGVGSGSGEQDSTTALIEAINIRSMSLIVLTSIASLYFIDWAQPVLLPLVVAVLISYALDPLVATLDRIHIPRPLGSSSGSLHTDSDSGGGKCAAQAGSHGHAGQDSPGHQGASA
ncbi:hypothetical protein Q672_03790 [Marinobacter sp. EVN1]|uniref:hypothetical protein n=1 Tax=Marinobacter sp. EVN1 TaxID=1397532 RepID=UPI0003B8B6B6|nr:hypothetical protein [Marinobacter sp. EVN1]ERS84607.1 hypothetical protein Q672_03790 [Marinobacter sp. EVN1]